MSGDSINIGPVDLHRKPGNILLNSPEFNVAIFAFLLNFVWEFIQVPYFEGMQEMSHWEGIKFCTGATFSDAIIAVFCFWSVAIFRSRSWITRPGKIDLFAFTALGVLSAIIIEWYSVEIIHRWAYVETYPVLPILGTGLTPLLQWILLPPLIVWFVKRQLT